MTLKSLTASIALFGLALPAAQAAGPSAPTDQEQARPEAAAPALQERRAVRDSVTGKLRAPTPEEQAAMAASRQARTAAPAPLAVRQHANGMRSAVLGREYMSTLKAERGSDGKLVMRHADPALEHAAPARPQTLPSSKE